ncbi:hypothetical protein SLS58_005486 [Diplodia intermedia]|uniref:Dihydrodipicolinate synthetase n=1 Tax=Diplodia intermedia TaxID=856260 RepID=A0ABR3TQN5_9PEZI
MDPVSPQPHVPAVGVWVPAVTFFDHATDTVDLAAQSRYFRYLASTGLTGIVALGTNLEAFLLTREERAAVIRAARRAVGPDYPLMAGVGAHSTKQTLELARDAKDAGANYLLALPPAYLGAKATGMDVVRAFFAELAAKAPLPVVVYNFPGVCNGVDIDSDTITSIVRQSALQANNNNGKSNVIGVKLTCGSVAKITRLAATFAPDEFAAFGGQVDFLTGALAAGGAGDVGAFANVFPRTAARIYGLWRAGRTDEATRLHRAHQGAVDKLKPRAPYGDEPVSEAAREAVRQAMAEVDKIERALLSGNKSLL